MDVYDVIIVGGGHAGYEAAAASARTGSQTLLITMSISTIGELSCNPSIGGQAKSNLVREIDIFGGIMGRAADFSSIHYKTLNQSKGPAVHATRSQNDRKSYANFVQRELFALPRLSLFQSHVRSCEPISRDHFIVNTDIGVTFQCSSVVISAGTFLDGTITIGSNRISSGRLGEPASSHLTGCLTELGHKPIRLKTGTPARILGRSIDFSVMEEQPGKISYRPFSFRTLGKLHNQHSCHITRTNSTVHDIISENLHRSPLYGTSPSIQGTGPRYCPSIEDKIVKFSDKPFHSIFIEPEGNESTEFYPNGLSSSLPFSVQKSFIHSISGLENAHITRPGYAIEYTAFDPRDLSATLESTHVPGLFLAGQINATSGYEEAGIQGLVAGCNASRRSQGETTFLYPDRTNSYMGVLIDDITTKGTTEPYRLFTSRSEYRLSLREDNTADRLLSTAELFNLIDARSANHLRQIISEKDGFIRALSSSEITPDKKTRAFFDDYDIRPPRQKTSLKGLLKRPDISWNTIRPLYPGHTPSEKIIADAVTHIRYEDFILRQQNEVEKYRKLRELIIPPSFHPEKVPGFTNEIIEIVKTHRPNNVAEFSSIPGVTPAAVSILILTLKKRDS